MTNVKDVARLAGVSPMTVSRVINGTGYVKEDTRNRVQKAMRELNYVPNRLARSLVRNRTHTLALIVPDITNPFFTTVVRGTEDTARKQGYQLILCNSDEENQKEHEYIEMCLSFRVDGVVIAPTGDDSKRNLTLLQRFGIPFVLVDRLVEGIDADIVMGDSMAGAQALVQHLIDLGHRDIGIITGHFNTSTGRLRLDGYKRALEQAGIPFRPEFVKETSFRKNARLEAVDELMECTPAPTALFCANNYVAAQAVQALRNRGLEVPKDVAIVCFDDIDPYSLAEPFLTAAMQPAYDFGSLSVQLLLERIDGAPVTTTRRIVLRPEVIIRRSSQNSPRNASTSDGGIQ